MKKFEFHKLVRNKLPSRMKIEGIIVHSPTLTTEEYRAELKRKLLEESLEVLEAPSLNEMKVELIDVLEVIEAIIQEYKFTNEEIEDIKLEKRNTNGSFEQSSYISYIEAPTTNQMLIKYLQNKNRKHTFNSA